MVSCERQYSEVLAVAHALYPSGISGKALFMFTAYFDDSGTHGGSPNVTVGGFVADVQEWEQFSREWALLLEEFELDKNPGYFHMVDYSSMQHPIYGAWGKDKRIDFMRKMTGIIKRRVRAGIAGTFPAHNLKKMQEVLPHTFPSEGYPYMTCGQVCWRNIGNWAREYNHAERVASVFEEGTEGKGFLLNAHAELTLKEEVAARFHLGGISFGLKRDVKPLQAADFFAYETHKRMKDTFANLDRRRKSVEEIVQNIPVYATFLNDAATAEIVEMLKTTNPLRVR